MFVSSDVRAEFERALAQLSRTRNGKAASSKWSPEAAAFPEQPQGVSLQSGFNTRSLPWKVFTPLASFLFKGLTDLTLQDEIVDLTQMISGTADQDRISGSSATTKSLSAFFLVITIKHFWPPDRATETIRSKEKTAALWPKQSKWFGHNPAAG